MRFGNVVGGGHHVMVKRVTSAGYEVVGRALTLKWQDGDGNGQRVSGLRSSRPGGRVG